MAFEQVTGKQTFKKATDLRPGESIEAYLVSAQESKGFPGKFDLLMQSAEGDNYVLSTAGSLKYFALDLNAGHADKAKCLGHFVRITRQEDYVNKKKQTVSSFRVDRDPERKLDSSEVKVAFDKAIAAAKTQDDAFAKVDELPF